MQIRSPLDDAVAHGGGTNVHFGCGINISHIDALIFSF
jgi:hypothetical protein